MDAIHFIAFLLGAVLAARTVYSAIQTFVLPRSARDFIISFIFRGLRTLFAIPLKKASTFEQRDRVMALFAPIGLMLLPPVFLFLLFLSFTLMYWGVGRVGTLAEAFKVSGSSLLTLGYLAPQDLIDGLLMYAEAALGLILVAVLIAYLPAIYGAFQRREQTVTMLEVRAGSPPSAVEMILRYQRIHGLERLTVVWQEWERWFADVEESHTSLAALVFFRSPQAQHSWVTAAGAVLDAASLLRSTIDVPPDPQADLCIRAGYLALRHIADFFDVQYKPTPAPTDPISLSRVEFDAACAEFEKNGVPLKSDRNQAWRDFVGWRVNYDAVLLAMAAITMAPYAPWSSDRSLLAARPASKRASRQKQVEE